jgi:hypothetical protein
MGPSELGHLWRGFLLHVLNQNLTAPGAHMSTMTCQIPGLGETSTCRSFLLWSLLLHLLNQSLKAPGPQSAFRVNTLVVNAPLKPMSLLLKLPFPHLRNQSHRAPGPYVSTPNSP